MGLFDFIFKKKTEKTQGASVSQEVQPQVTIAFHEEEYRKALSLYDEAHADKEYQKHLSEYFELLTKIKETYSVINNRGMRGRLARMIKKGNLTLTDNLKELLNL